MIARHEPALRKTARRFSLDPDDAEDAYQRALEIVLTKAPTTDPRDLIRWTQTVTKHEALAQRQSRERLLGRGGEDGPCDPVAGLAAEDAGPDERVVRREEVARSREALHSLKPAELRALGLLAEGYSYAEIGRITGFSQTKVNRVLTEGRSRFRSALASSADGSRCRELRPLLSAFCDGEARPRDAAAVREHLRACASCRATMRAYRAVPGIAAALAPSLPPGRSLLERAHELLAGIGSRLPGAGGDPALQLAAGGGSRGAGMAGLAKLLTLCAGAAGGAACVATGVSPAPLLGGDQARGPAIERTAERPADGTPEAAPQYVPAPDPPPVPPREERQPAREGEEEGAGMEEASVGAIEYEPPAEAPAAAPEAAPAASPGASATSGSAAGEFGP